MSRRGCEAPGCERPYDAKGWCRRHYWQITRYGRLLAPGEGNRRNGATCEAPGCERDPLAKGLCQRHYKQMRRLGRLLPPEGEDTGPRGGPLYLVESWKDSCRPDRDRVPRHRRTRLYRQVTEARRSAAAAEALGFGPARVYVAHVAAWEPLDGAEDGGDA